MNGFLVMVRPTTGCDVPVCLLDTKAKAQDEAAVASVDPDATRRKFGAEWNGPVRLVTIVGFRDGKVISTEAYRSKAAREAVA